MALTRSPHPNATGGEQKTGNPSIRPQRPVDPPDVTKEGSSGVGEKQKEESVGEAEWEICKMTELC